MFDPERIANAEYALDLQAAITEQTEFGVFLHNPTFKASADATKLVKAYCPPGGARSLLAYVEDKCDAFGVAHRLICGYGTAPFAELMPLLTNLGYEYEVYWALRKARPARRSINPKVEIRVYEPALLEGILDVYASAGFDEDDMQYARMMLRSLDGREVVAFLDREPVAVGGWYVYDRVTRFTQIATHPHFQGQGIAATLIEFICRQPGVRNSDAIILCTDEAGPIPMYEQLGFVRNNFLWIYYGTR